ncbi:heterokaryon incompatibility protein-domain-containing protein [Aspergillus bertholletiae]|uniref:Heterokaryon incompatibility protein-domain-containing protein n=1 Tax=Aspergillus bertholletiae TaxID=1226010 RepID=A0A5N7B8J1_9EURO|nr:heterokaryon incompatibility protein-domain-containing protein [Aspergillus bertholletiae]
MEPFKYEPLDLDGPAFRLVRIYHGEGPEINCELFQAWLYPEESVISYEALSYTWGSTASMETIRMGGKQLHITPNLYFALQHLRWPHEDRILWVDGICIDQANEKERGHQVRHMGDVYKQAERVIFWLGPPTYATNVILDSLQQFHKESTRHRCKKWELSDPRWVDLWSAVQPGLKDRHSALVVQQREGLQELLGRPWFRRVWIIQEVAHARAGLVCCGQRSVSAHIFPLAPLLLGIAPDTHSQAVLDIMPGSAKSGTWWNMNRDLYTLLQKFSASEASLPHDTVYALLGISSDAQDTDMLRPNYANSEHDVIHDVMCFLFDEFTYDRYQSYFKTVRDLVKDLQMLNTSFLKHCMRSSNLTGLENVLEWRQFGISQADITTAAQAACNDKQSLEYIDNASPVETWDYLMALEHVLQRRGYNPIITEEVVLTILSMNYNKQDTLISFLQQRRDEINITEEVFVAMLENRLSAPKRFDFGSNVESLGVYKTDIARLFLQQQGAEIQITERVLIAAASKNCYTQHLMQLLLQERGDQIEITEKVLVAAVHNENCGLKHMQLFISQLGDTLRITEKVRKAASWSASIRVPNSSELTQLLKKHDTKMRLQRG